MSRHRTRLVAWVFIGGLLGVPEAIGQQTFVIYGAGNVTCGDVVKARAGRSTDDQDTQLQVESWLQGYVTGMAETGAAGNNIRSSNFQHTSPEITAARRAYCQKTPTDPVCRVGMFTTPFQHRTGDIIRKTNANGMEVWLDGYCSSHALDKLHKAAGELLRELREGQK